MTKLSKPRRRLLEALTQYGGSLKGKQLTVPDRGLASSMQADDLVKWERPSVYRRYTNLDEWTLHITDKGREALNPSAPAS